MLEGHRKFIAVKVKDVSQTGICITAPERWPPNSCVEIRLADLMLLGEVVHCGETPDGFDTGIRLGQCLDLGKLRGILSG